MSNSFKSALFILAMFSMTVACQSKKTETENTSSMDTATVVESETVVSGDSALVATDTAKIVMPDSVKK